MRDGDIELYRMDADGKNVKRLTHTPGYDGGAFFNADCTQDRLARVAPKPGKELDEYQALLAQRPRAPDASSSSTSPTPTARDARQITYLDAASFAPFFHPSESASSSRRTTAIRKGASSTSGRSTSTARTSSASPCAAASTASRCSRPTASGSRSRRTGRRRKAQHDTNVFVARWVEAPSAPSASVSARSSPRRRSRDATT